MPNCYFDYDQAVLLKFWVSRKSAIRDIKTQNKLGLVMGEKVTAASIPKSDNIIECGLGFSDELLRTSLTIT